MSASPLVELFARHVIERPLQPAIVQRNRSTTYQELSDRMLRCGVMLRSRGVRPGDRVILFVPPSADLYALLLSIWRLGAVAVFVDAWTSRDRLGEVVDLVGPSLFIGIPRSHLLRILHPRARRIPSMIWWTGRDGPKSDIPPIDVDPSSTALITFTTGSTGSPKGADRSHLFLLSQHEALCRTLGTRPGSTDLATLPFFALHDLASGATCRIASLDPARPDKIDTKRFSSELHGSDTSAGSPAIYLALARSLPATDPTIRARIHLGGAAVFPETMRELSNAFPNATFHAVYGSTEAEPIAVLDGHILSQSRTSPEEGIPAGRPDPSLALRILVPHETPIETNSDDNLRLLGSPAGCIGEIVVAGPHVLQTYWNDPIAVATNKIRTRERTWHRTGDAGRIDAEGNLFLYGRLGEGIRVGDQIHYPFPIQRRLLAIEGVHCGCAVQMPEGIVLAVEPQEGIDRGALALRIRETSFPFPFCVHFLQIPRDPRHRSKIDMPRLQAKLFRQPRSRNT